MTNWISTLTGVDTETVPPDADVSLTWTNLPHSWHVFLMLGIAAALVGLVVWLYRRENAKLSSRQRGILGGLRIAAMLLLLVIFLGPALGFRHQRILQPVIVLLRDNSQSMQTRDPYPDDQLALPLAGAVGLSPEALRQNPPTRADLSQLALQQDDLKLLEELQQRGRLRVMNFADAVELVENRTAIEKDKTPADADAPEPLPELSADGKATDIYRAVSEALSQRLTASVILVTDGQHTNRDTGRDDLLALANKAADLQIPLLVAGVGDPRRPRNVQVSEVYADAQVWKDEPFEIQAVVRTQGLAGEKVTLKLIEKSPSGTEREIGSQQIDVQAGAGHQRVPFNHTPKTAGRFSYLVRSVPVEHESTTKDNQPKAAVAVKVIDEQAKVLLVAGVATWEYRAVRQLLEREKSVELSCWLQTLDTDRAQEGNTVIKQLPVEREDWFQYDVIVMIDPDPKEFDADTLDILKQFINEHAGGLLYMAGPVHAGRFLSSLDTESLRDLLPVRLGDVGAMEVAALLESNDREWPLGVIAANADQPIMRLFADRTQTLEAWRKFPGIFWSFPAASAAPAARVLLEHSDPALKKFAGSRPLLVTGNFGAGRTIYVGFDGTWRWRQLGTNAEFFNRFWLQATRYLVEGRSMEGKRRGTIETERIRYELGDRIQISAALRDSTFKPLTDPEVTGTIDISGEAKSSIVLRAVPNQPGQYQTSMIANKTGRHIVSVNLKSQSAEAPKIESTFSVTLPLAETEKTWLDKPLLVEMANASGGKYFGLHELAELPAAIPNKQQTLVTQGKPIPLWDTGNMLVLLVVLLGTEWALRKRWKLL